MGEAQEVEALVQRMRPLLAGRASQVQGAALADLLAIFVAGHIIKGDPGKTQAMRERLLTLHIDVVRQLVDVNSETIHGERS